MSSAALRLLKNIPREDGNPYLICCGKEGALYELSQGNRNMSLRYLGNSHSRDISEYQVNEPAPTDGYLQNIHSHLLALAASRPDILVTMRHYVRKWAA